MGLLNMEGEIACGVKRGWSERVASGLVVYGGKAAEVNSD
jgi:hypothetical protein